MSKKAEKVSRLFDEPKSPSGLFKVHHVRSYGITSPNFVYDLETIEKEKLINMQKHIEKLIRYMYDKVEVTDDCLSLMLLYLIRIVVSHPHNKNHHCINVIELFSLVDIRQN